MSDSVSSLERAMELAKTNNVNNVVVNIALDITGVSHTISLKLSKNKDKKWKAVFYDSNDIITDTNKNALETLIKKAGIEGKLEKSPVVIPNTKEGHCDMISYITSAALTFGNEHVNNVRNHCNKLRATCAKTLGEKLNTEIHETLKAKLDEFAKSQLKKEESKDPPKSITKATDCKMIAEIQQICGIDEYEGIGR
jgi:hypothetical protein